MFVVLILLFSDKYSNNLNSPIPFLNQTVSKINFITYNWQFRFFLSKFHFNRLQTINFRF
ncbi:hypothetical protein DLK05_07390 [Ancylomarina longa]|uniref:Uncharacterized protein n=1 Tax=Ancylomarina longa TaxID=2487017 RepID=A0A434AW03_9BACT|nr:hypothetical protein DLK05_07390 [Ancylomarina longa]